MRSSQLYETILEKSYFFNSRFNKMKATVEQVTRVSNDIKSSKLVNEDPVTFEFVTKGELSQERQNQIADYIQQQQESYYSYTIEGTKKGFRLIIDVGYIEMDDSLPEPHDPTVLMKGLTRKVMAKLHSLQNREPEKYRGAGKARCWSNYGRFEIEFPYLDKVLSKEYSLIITNIIENNDGEVTKVNITGDKIRFDYKDSSKDITPESYLRESISDKREQYNEYLDKHVYNVVDSFNKLLELPEDKKPDLLKDDSIVERLKTIVKDHDKSKWDKEEYEPYRIHFYPDNSEEKLSTEEYQNAWVHHHQNNPHHWQYWCIVNPDTGLFELKPDIDELEYRIYTIERVCDWCSCSRMFNNRVKDWYEENKDEIVQPDFIIPFIEYLLDLCNDYEVDKIKGE